MRKTLLLLAAASLAWTAQAQDSRPLAIANARILTMAGGQTQGETPSEISAGTVLVRNGVIEAVGPDVEIPAGYQVVDARGGTLMPGLVSAWSHAGLASAPAPRIVLRGGRRGGRGRRGGLPTTGRNRASNRAATVVARSIYPRQDVFGELLEAGVTTLALTPRGSGFPGTGAILNPAGKSLDELATNEDAFLWVSPAVNNAAKTVLREGFEAAKQVVEERNKPPEPPAEEADTETTDEEKKADEQATGEQEPPAETQQAGARGRGRRGRGDEPDKDPNHEVLADLLEGKKRAFLTLSSANDLVHYLDAVGEVSYPKTIVTTSAGGGARGRRGRGGGGSSGSLELVIDKVKALDATLLLPPTLGTYPGTNAVVNPPASLHAQGLEIGFVLGDTRQAVENLFFQLMELVRCGLPRDVALRGITQVPAKTLGLESEVGSIAVGKAADLLLFSGDPLDPESRLLRVWHKGRQVRGEDR